MSTSVLIGYATRYGSNREVAEAVAAALREHGLKADIHPMREIHTLAGYSTVVLGAPLFMFHLHRDALRFLLRHRKVLVEKPVAMFVLGPTHDPHDEQEWQDSQNQLDKELTKFPWFTPIDLKLFGGRYDPSKLRFPLKLFAGSVPASDIRDWTAIRNWAMDLSARIKPSL